MYQPVRIISESSSVSTSTSDWFRQVFSDVSGSSVTVTENGGDLPANQAKIEVVKNGVRLAPGDDYSVAEPAINFVEALDGDTIVVTFISDSSSNSTLIDDIVPLADAKAHLKVDFDDDDDLIQLYIMAARQVCERYMNRALVPKVIEESLHCFPEVGQQTPFREMRLSWGPLIQVDEIRYFDSETPSVEQTIDGTDLTDNFVTDTAPIPPVVHPISAYVFPKTDTRKYPVTVKYQAGYNSTDLVPQPIKHAMLLMIGEMYERREDGPYKLPTWAKSLLNNYKIPNLA